MITRVTIFWVTIKLGLYSPLANGGPHDTFTEVKCEIGGHLGFFHLFRSFYTFNDSLPCCIMCLSDSLSRKYRFRHPNHDPTWSSFRDIGNFRFWGGHFKRGPQLVASPSFFTGNIAHMIPESPWTKWYNSWRIIGRGCMGTPVSSRTFIDLRRTGFTQIMANVT